MGFNSVILFILGLGVGSFINVLSLRYDPDRRIFRRGVIGGRSRCMQCARTLRWFELIPLLSFLFLSGRCRTCSVKLSFQYPLVELAGGLLALFIPLRLSELYVFQVHGAEALPYWFVALCGVFLLAAFTMLFIAAVDARLTIIPDQANALIAASGIGAAAILFFSRVAAEPFTGHYALLFGFQDSLLWNRLIAFLFGAAFFGAIVLLTRGRGMGLGDVKFAAALGLLMGWPDIVFASFLSFILGAFSGILLLIRGAKNMKSAVPFGPFIAAGAIIIFFFGDALMRGYFTLFP